jgi:hypothetical protein
MNALGMDAPRPQRRWWPWPMLWILAAVGHVLGNVPHPLPVPVPPAMPAIEVPQQVVPSDRPDWDWGPETAQASAATLPVPVVSADKSSRDQ